MNIPDQLLASVRELNVDSQCVIWEPAAWYNWLGNDEATRAQLEQVERLLPKRIRRRDLVQICRDNGPGVPSFLATMIWGYSAPEGGRPDNRGPSKVALMLATEGLDGLLSGCFVGTDEETRSSFNAIRRNVAYCGPSFLTKYLYFLGKAMPGNHRYPVIFDNRVAQGLVKLLEGGTRALDMVAVQVPTSVDAYMNYLQWVNDESQRIRCERDQLELFLFSME